jgi:hypothetical protein
VRAVIVCLNFLYGVRPPARVGKVGVHNGPQLKALQVIITACCKSHSQLASDSAPPRSASEIWASFERGPENRQLRLIADLVDLPACAATCDPLQLIPAHARAKIATADALFPCPPDGLERFADFFRRGTF